jgi:phosphotransacetylase
LFFREGCEDRILQATARILELEIAKPILIGNPSYIKRKAKTLDLKIDWKEVEIIDHKNLHSKKL